jgi:hypothetical protein
MRIFGLSIFTLALIAASFIVGAKAGPGILSKLPFKI